MCLACGHAIFAADWALAGAAGLSARSGEDRLVGLLTSLLAPENVVVSRARLSPGVQISTPAGQAARAATVDALWPALQSLTGRALDPLDPRFLDAAAEV